jgi:hypothetical protein
MGVPIRDYLKNRRDRALGAILGYSEREIYKGLTDEERSAFRRVVLDALNGYHDSVLDLIKAEDATTMRNDEVVALLERIEQKVS